MSKQILVNASSYETRVATLEDGEIKQLHIEREEDRNVVGNIYKGLVKRVLPGMQAAFLELGLERTAFLYVDDIIDEPFGTEVEVVDSSSESDGDYSEDLDEEESTHEKEGETTEEASAPETEINVEPSEFLLTAPSISKAALSQTEPRPEVQPTPEETAKWQEEGGGFEDDDDFIEEDEGYDEGEDDRGYEDRDRGGRDDDRDRGKDRDRGEGRGYGARGEDPGEGDRDRDRDRDRERGDRGFGEPQRAQDRGYERGGDRDRDQDRDRDRDDRGGDRSEQRGDDRSRRAYGRNQGRNEGRGGRRFNQRGGRGQRFRRRSSHRRPRGTANIQDLLKEGQEILVQVAKAPIGTKGARLTTHISLPGRNLVLMPTVKHLGISRRIENERERRRLRDIFLKKIRTKNVGFIIRTVADGKSLKDLKADSDYLINLWVKIEKDAKRKRAPALIHEDMSLSMRAVRDFFTDDIDSLIIDNTSEYETTLNFIDQFMPRLKSRVKLFRGPSQLFEHYGIEAEISRALGRKVWLKSGGYLLFDQSEALTAIDVNTGRYVGSKSLEETILRTNLEAVKEVAYQLRIRNVGGIIIIDLIDMENPDNREKVFHALQEALGEDKAKTNILKISDLGLVEMTRKRTHEDLVRYLTEACSICEGRGYHKSQRTICFEIFREVEKEALTNTPNIVVFANPKVVDRLNKEERKHVAQLEEKYQKKLLIKPDPNLHAEQYEVYGKN